LELRDLVVTNVHLHPGFGDLQTRKNIQFSSLPIAKDIALKSKLKRTPCVDCTFHKIKPCFTITLTLALGGKTHKEVFTFDKATKGKMKNKEWELLVALVIKKWGDYLEEHF